MVVVDRPPLRQPTQTYVVQVVAVVAKDGAAGVLPGRPVPVLAASVAIQVDRRLPLRPGTDGVAVAERADLAVAGPRPVDRLDRVAPGRRRRHKPVRPSVVARGQGQGREGAGRVRRVA